MLIRQFLLCAFSIMVIPVGSSAAVHQVNMVSFAFVPETLTIQQGDTVIWVNQAQMNHTSTSGTDGVPDGIWDSGLVSPGDSFMFAFDTLHGNFPYYCTPHWQLGMVGLIISNGEEIHENGHAVSSLQIIASYPNPFSKTVNLRYQIRSAGIVIARIINGLGQDVKYIRREYACPGVHSISWNGKNDAEIQQPHGVYLIILEFNGRRVYSNLIYCAP